MKSINTYINEALRIKTGAKIATGPQYKYHPETKDELVAAIKEKMSENGVNANLNDIDVSKIEDFDYLFSSDKKGFGLSKFNGDISNWNVSKAIYMNSMFFGSEFDGDLSKWNVSKVETMQGMFADAAFTGKNGDISKWDVSNLENASYMFNYSKFSENVNNWKFNPQKLMNLEFMFANNNTMTKFDISHWTLSKFANLKDIFEHNPLKFNYKIYPQQS